MKRRNIVFFVGMIISIFALYWVFKDVRFGQLWESLKAAHLGWVLLSTVIFYVSMYLRSVRWAWYFRPNYQFNGRDLFRPLMIGFGFNCIMPGRVGEIARAYQVGTRKGTGIPTALATIVTERIFDAATLLGMLAVSLVMLPPIDPDVTIDFWGFTVRGSMLGPLMQKIVIGSIVLVTGVVVFMIPAVQRFAIGFPYMVPKLPAKLQTTLSNFIRDTARGFESIRNPTNLAVIVVYSLLIWGLAGWSTQIMSFAFDGVHLSFLHALALMSLIAIFILVPAAPGYWGLFEAGGLFTLTVFGLMADESVGTAYVLVLHLSQYLPILAVGLAYAAMDQFQLRTAIEETPSEQL